jgi:phage recombination protein Bet
MNAVTQEVITAADVRAAEQKRTSLVEKMATKYGLEPNRMMATLKATAFKGDVTNEQMAALLIVADQHNLNPWLKEIYAFPSRQGIVPIVGVDGWARIINEHPEFDGMDFEQDEEKCTCRIHRKDRAHPVAVTEYLAECRRPTDPWNTHPKRMLRHKAMIQAARIAFSFAGIYDPDEGERVLAAENAIDVTPTYEPPTGIPEGTKEKRIGHAKLRKAVENITKYTENKNADELMKLWREFDQDQQLYVWGFLTPWVRKAFKEIESVSRKTTGIGDLPSFSIELLKSCKNATELDAAWRKIQDAFTEADQEVPDNVAMTCDEMRSSMGTV